MVLANVGVLLWGVQYVEPERPTPPPAPSDIRADDMKLLSELPAHKLATRSKSPPPEPTPVVPPPIVEAGVCHRLGPVADAAAAKKAEQTLAAESLPFTKREEQVPGPVTYRVYLPPFSSRAEAERKRRELTRLGFRDHALMQEPDFENAVSLGVFSVEENAQNHLKRLAEKGVKAEMLAQESKRNVAWFEIASRVPRNDTGARLKRLVDAIAGAEVSEIPCPAPALPSAPAL